MDTLSLTKEAEIYNGQRTSLKIDAGWMKLEPIIQSEVSQKDKDHYNILTRIYGI